MGLPLDLNPQVGGVAEARQFPTLLLAALQAELDRFPDVLQGLFAGPARMRQFVRG